jgi:phosphoglycerate dehydrogenase-like enzyme
MFRLALLDDYQNVALRMADWSRLADRVTVEPIHAHIADPTRLAERLHRYDAVMMVRERTKFPRAMFEQLPNLKLLITAAMWNVAIDLDAATEHGVQVTGTRDWPFATAELALGLMLSLARHIPHENRTMHEGQWQTKLGSGLNGKTLGLLGLGSLGSQMATFGTMLGMEVLAWSQNLTQESAAAGGATWTAKDELLARSDYVSIHLKLSDRTRGLIGRRELGLMKPTAYLINTSRGPITDEDALIEHLQKGRIAGAAIDVYGVEPLPADHPMRQLDNAILLPHVGYVVEQNYRLVYGDTLEDVEAFLDGRILRPLNTLPTA